MNNSTQASMISLDLDQNLPSTAETESTSTFELREEFPEIIDNTIRSSFVKCPQYMFRSHVQNLRSRGGVSIDLTAGGAFAKGLEVCRTLFYGHGYPANIAEEKGLAALVAAYGPPEQCPEHKANKSLANTMRAFESYFLEYPLATDRIKPFISPNGAAAVEFTFSVPIPGTRHPVTGDPLIYAGRFDMLGTYNGQLFVVDEKTTSQLGDQWRRQWDLDSQFTGYCWAARSYGYPVAGAIIRGVGFLKTKITHAEAIVYRAPWFIDRWLNELERDCNRMVQYWENYRFVAEHPLATRPPEDAWPRALDKSACDAYSGCPFKTLCSSQNPDEWLETNYEVHKWDPLAKH